MFGAASNGRQFDANNNPIFKTSSISHFQNVTTGRIDSGRHFWWKKNKYWKERFIKIMMVYVSLAILLEPDFRADFMTAATVLFFLHRIKSNSAWTQWKDMANGVWFLSGEIKCNVNKKTETKN